LGIKRKDYPGKKISELPHAAGIYGPDRRQVKEIQERGMMARCMPVTRKYALYSLSRQDGLEAAIPHAEKQPCFISTLTPSTLIRSKA
jgi:hypothetical protein